MKILVIADIHGNAEALRAVLAKESDADTTVFLGDSVSPGPQPNETIDLMARERLGISVRRRSGRTVILHGGDNGGYRASLTGVLETGAGAIVLTNGRSRDGLDLRRELAQAVLPIED